MRKCGFGSSPEFWGSSHLQGHVHSAKSSEEVEVSQACFCFLLISQTYLGKLLKRTKEGYWQGTISKNIGGKIIKQYVKLRQKSTFCLPCKM